jgi:hypothetical protein
MKHIYTLLDLAGGGTIPEAGQAWDAALDWLNATSKQNAIRWFEQRQIAAQQDPADILDPMDGELRADWADLVVMTRAVAVMLGET